MRPRSAHPSPRRTGPDPRGPGRRRAATDRDRPAGCHGRAAARPGRQPGAEGGHRLHRRHGARHGSASSPCPSSSSRRSTAACWTTTASTAGSCSGVRADVRDRGAVYVASRATYRRLVRATEDTLYGLRVRVFTHIHALSIADHAATRRGVLVSRVTSDVETLARSRVGRGELDGQRRVILGVVVVMFVYAWQLTLITLGVFVPMLFILRHLQRRQLPPTTSYAPGGRHARRFRSRSGRVGHPGLRPPRRHRRSSERSAAVPGRGPRPGSSRSCSRSGTCSVPSP